MASQRRNRSEHYRQKISESRIKRDFFWVSRPYACKFPLKARDFHLREGILPPEEGIFPQKEEPFVLPEKTFPPGAQTFPRTEGTFPPEEAMSPLREGILAWQNYFLSLSQPIIQMFNLLRLYTHEYNAL